MIRKTLSYPRRREIEDYLTTVLRRGEDGLCEYLAGESDATVAKRFDCTDSNVAGVTVAMFGKLRPAPTKVACLEDRVRTLEGFLDEIHPAWRQRKSRLEDA